MCVCVFFSSAGKTSVISNISSRDLREILSYFKACHMLAVSTKTQAKGLHRLTEDGPVWRSQNCVAEIG